MKKQNHLGVTPKNDLVFKRLFGSKGNEAILKDFLESILDIEIDSLILDLNTELLPEFHDGKQTRVDVRTLLADGTNVNIEMQMNPADYSDKRCLQHWSKLYSNNIKVGRKYSTLNKTICIWIIDGKIYNEFDDIDSKWEIMNKKYGLSNHFNELEIYIIELQKLKDSVTIKSSNKKFWLWFIDHTNEELINMACISNERIREAREQLDKIMADEELMERIRLEENFEYDMNTRMANAEEEGLRRGMEKGIKEGIKEGKEKGKLENQIEIAKKMLDLNTDIDFIEKVTGLSKEEILKLKEDLL